MNGRSFKSVAWVGGVGLAALACYMVSLNVAAEARKVAEIDARILQTKKDIRSLETELGTRGRFAQLDRWNQDVLALSAPLPGQFVRDEYMLARFDGTAPGVGSGNLAGNPQVRMADATTTQAPVTPAEANAPSKPEIRMAKAEPPRSTELLRRVSYVPTREAAKREPVRPSKADADRAEKLAAALQMDRAATDRAAGKRPATSRMAKVERVVKPEAAAERARPVRIARAETGRVKPKPLSSSLLADLDDAADAERKPSGRRRGTK